MHEWTEQRFNRLRLERAVDDPEAGKDDMIRVIDESGEDYLFPSGRFVAAPLPAAVEEAVLLAKDESAA